MRNDAHCAYRMREDFGSNAEESKNEEPKLMISTIIIVGWLTFKWHESSQLSIVDRLVMEYSVLYAIRCEHGVSVYPYQWNTEWEEKKKVKDTVLASSCRRTNFLLLLLVLHPSCVVIICFFLFSFIHSNSKIIPAQRRHFRVWNEAFSAMTTTTTSTKNWEQTPIDGILSARCTHVWCVTTQQRHKTCNEWVRSCFRNKCRTHRDTGLHRNAGMFCVSPSLEFVTLFFLINSIPKCLSGRVAGLSTSLKRFQLKTLKTAVKEFIM